MRREGLFLLAAVVSCGCAWGQAGGFGIVTGIILDRAGSGLPDTTVVLSNEALGTEITLNTTDDGVFTAPTVVPAVGYRLKVTRKDFAGWDSDDFTVSTGQKVNFAVVLPPAESADNAAKPEAQGGALLVDDHQSGLGSVLSPQQVAEAPNSGRRLESLVPLAPTVTMANSAPGLLVFHGVASSNRLLTDGILTTNTYSSERPGTTNHLNAEAVQDFQVASAGFAADFGGAMGGVVDAGTRSGTNAYHGEAYEYFRNRPWQAEDRYAAGFDTGQKQHQAGASVGGPIRAGQIFFFLNFDGLSRTGQGLNRITNPLLADAAGTHVLAADCHATAAQCALATQFLQAQMNVPAPLWEHSFRGLAKIDYRRSDRNSFTFEANAVQFHAPSLAEIEQVAPNGGLLGDPLLRNQARYAKIGWTTTTSSQVTNDFRIAWFLDRVTEQPSNSGLVTGPLGISIAGTTVGASLPAAVVLPSERRIALVDNGNFTLGSNSFRVGIELLKTRDYIDSLSNPAGLYEFSSLTAFAQDFGLTGQKNYTTFKQTFGNPVRSLHIKDLNLFAQDTWKATGRLTVTGGLRYERPTLPQPTQVNPNYFQTASVTSPWLNLSPRVGLAYMLNGRTVVRAGFGFYYAPFPGQLVDALFLGNAVYQTSIAVNPNQAGAPSFPHIIPLSTQIPSGTTNVTYSDSSLRSPYAQELSLALERNIGAGFNVTLSALHSRGTKLWTTQDFSQANPTTQITPETYVINDANGQPNGSYATNVWIAKNDPNIAHLYQIENGGSSWYNAASLQVSKRMSHGLGLAASYTFSHAIDNTGQSAPFGTAFSSSVTGSYNTDKGNAAFDQRQHAVIQWLWQPTVAPNSTKAARYLLNGWLLSTFTTLASSQPATAIVVVQGQQFSGVTMDYTSSLNGSGGWARVPFLPVNSLRTGPQYNVDARLARTIPISERIKATLMFEAFNAFNTQYDTAVNTLAYTSVGALPAGAVTGTRAGMLTPVAGVGKGIAAQGFPDGTNARRLQAAVRIVF